MTVIEYMADQFDYDHTSDGFILKSPLVYNMEVTGKGFRADIVIKLEPGFRAKFPHVFWKNGAVGYNAAMVMRSALYSNRGFGMLQRADCDDIFHGILGKCGISRWRADVVETYFRWFRGDSYWKLDLSNAGKSKIHIEIR